jgi:hypothetical protein
METPFLRLDDRDYREIMTDAAVSVLGVGGIDRFSVRAMARWMKVVPATILNDYNRARVLEIVIIRFAPRWLTWSGSQSMFGPSPSRIPLLLPSTPDERLGVRILSALQHLADAELLRGNKAPAIHLDRLREEELELLRFRLTPVCCSNEPDDVVVQAVMAFIRGLRLSLSEGSSGLAVTDATDLLSHFVEPAITHTAACADGRLIS